jgi:outer membrane immunogenic protein
MRFQAFAALTLVSTLTIAPAAAQEFGGPRLEVRAGYDALSVNDAYEDLPGHLAGPAVTGAIGYDHALSARITLGLELGLTLPTGGSRSAQLGLDRLTIEPDRDIDILVRLGRAVGDRTLLFAKVGYANSKVQATYETGAGPIETERFSSSQDGVRIGAGVEHIIARGLSATAEYRFTAYDDHVRRNHAAIGLAYRF